MEKRGKGMIFQGRQALPACRWRAYDAVKAIFRLVCRSRTTLADIAVKCSEKTARGLTIAAESSPFGRPECETTAKAMADLSCCPL